MYCLLIHLTSNDPRTVQVFLSKRPLQIGFRATTNNNISTYNNTNLHNIHDFLKAQTEISTKHICSTVEGLRVQLF